MANYGIMRMAKIKHGNDLRLISNHDNRVDYGMISLSHILAENKNKWVKIQGSGDYSKDYRQALEKHKQNGLEPLVKKNAVLGWDIVLTATDFKNINIDKWVKSNQEWLNKTFGKDNVHTMVLHCDETTPHLHCFVTPFHYSEKLERYVSGVKHWTNGTVALRNLQDSYYDTVSKQFGLSRGIDSQTTGAKHTEAPEFRSKKARKSFEEYWMGLKPSERLEWAYKANLRLSQLDKNSSAFKHYQTQLEKIKKSEPELFTALEKILSNTSGSIAEPNKFSAKATPQDKSFGMMFKLGAMFMASVMAQNETVNTSMSALDLLMKVEGYDLETAKKILNKDSLEM